MIMLEVSLLGIYSAETPYMYLQPVSNSSRDVSHFISVKLNTQRIPRLLDYNCVLDNPTRCYCNVKLNIIKADVFCQIKYMVTVLMRGRVHSTYKHIVVFQSDGLLAAF